MAANSISREDDARWPASAGLERCAERLADYTSWRVGGPADRLYLPGDLDDLCNYLSRLQKSTPVFWLGLGSNLLVRDGGIRGVVVCTKNRLKRMDRLEGYRLQVESGVPCALVARLCAEAGWRGAEFLAGIPGTLGGALAMNAGAFGGETWDLVQRVRTVDRTGVSRWRDRREFGVGYRSVAGLEAEEWFVGAEFVLHPGSSEESRNTIKALLAQRACLQPTNLPSCGSVFRNPPGDHAGRLVEACGLKGYQIGGAQVSTKHANFIVNVGDASAWDIERLIMHVQSEVCRQHGINLIPEVRIVGESLAEVSPTC